MLKKIIEMFSIRKEVPMGRNGRMKALLAKAGK